MKKIEPVAWQYRAKIIGGAVTTEWRSCCFSEYTWHKVGKYNEVVHYEVRELYTSEVLEAVAEAMKQECQAEVKRAFGLEESFEAIDTAAIINQLTGE